MTEAAFQECRKVMQKANYLRGLITLHKGNVAKWSNIESSHRENLKQGQADGAKKCLDKAMLKLDEIRKKFAALKFPDPELTTVVERCGECKRKVAECTCNY